MDENKTEEQNENADKGTTTPSKLSFSTLLKELKDMSDQKEAKMEPKWAFFGGWAANIAAWIIFIFVGSGIVNILPLLICLGGVGISIFVIRPAQGKWKYLTLLSLADSVWMLVWIIL